jgi:uncharacterized membrane protein YbhN (UPF0104 family)
MACIMSEGLRRWWPWLKLVLAVAVVVGLGWHLLRILRTEELSHGDTRSPSEVLWDSIRAANGWGMLLAGLCYLAALGLSAAFWLWLTDSTGEKLPLLAGLRGYYISHLGKYAPGKGLALIMRTGMAAEAGCRASVAVLTAVYETLTTMAAGALLAAILLLFQDGDEGLLWKALGLLALAGVPILPGVFNRVVERLTRRVLRGRIGELPRLKGYALLVGLFLNTFGWLLMGASLELMLLAMAPQAGTPGLIASTSFVAVSYVAGFIVPTPGGLGVREWLLANMLLPRLRAEAVVAALVLRLLWTAAEVVMAALVWWLPHKTVKVPPLAA